MVDIAIVAHPKRRAMAEQLHSRTGGLVIFDAENQGAARTHAEALRWLAEGKREDYGVVLEDDAIPVDGFIEQLSGVLAVAPTAIVNFYLGTGYPAQWQDILRRSVSPFEGDPHFLLAPEMLSMVGYAVRADLLGSLARTVEEYADRMGPDAAVSRFCHSRCLRVAYTRPSIVDHRDGEPIVATRFDGQPRTKARRAWRFGARSVWEADKKATLEEPRLVDTDEHGCSWYEVEGERVYE